MLILLLRMVAFLQKQSSLAWFIRCATYVISVTLYVLYECSSVAPRYLYCLTCVSRCPFTFTSHCFSGVFSTIIVFVFLAFMPYHIFADCSLSIMYVISSYLVNSAHVNGQGSQKLYNSSLKLWKNEVYCRRLYDTNLSSMTYHVNISKTERRWDNCTYMLRPLQYMSHV